MKEIAEKILTNGDKLLDHYVDCYYKTTPAGFNVLNHGDFHIRNLMFHKDSIGTPTEVMFLDFQGPLYISLGFDVVYLINCISGSDVRNRRNEFIRLYHSKLVENLTMYGFTVKVPTLIAIHIEIIRMSHLSILFFFIHKSYIEIHNFLISLQVQFILCVSCQCFKLI